MKFSLFTSALMMLGLALAPPAVAADTTAAHLKIDFHVKPERLADFMAIMGGVDSAMQAEAGFRAARVYVHMDDPTRVTLMEVWDTRALHKAHYDAIVADGSWASILEMQVTAPQMGYFMELAKR